MADLLQQILSRIGISATTDALLWITALIAGLIGFFCARFFAHRQQRKLQNEFDDQIDQLGHTFNTLSHQALQSNNESFLMLAQQSFEKLQSHASHELKTREQSFANLLQPIKQSMQQTDEHLRLLNLDRKATEAKLGEQINNLLSSQHTLQAETRNLVTALRRPEVRGRWGELTLKRLVELAGMSEYCDFTEQITIKTEHGTARPDMLIRLPSDRQLVVDVKTPLDAYISASEASNDSDQTTYLKKHSQNVKDRIKELSRKQYWQQFEKSPDFVILFIPGDQFLSAALDYEKDLLEYALQKRILLATPTSLVGLLRAVAYGWNQDSLNKNSVLIRDLGQSLYTRLHTLTEHLNKLGKQLDKSVEQFNNVAGSYQSNTLPAARKLSDLGLGDQPLELDTPATPTTRQLKTSDSFQVDED